MSNEEFEKFLKELGYLTNEERVTYYAMFVAAPEETKNKIVEFFLNQKNKLSEIHGTYDKKVVEAKEKFNRILNSFTDNAS